jgi:hypothetical protein
MQVTSYARPVADANTDAEAGAQAGDGGDGGDQRSEPLISSEALGGITKALGWLLAISGAGLVVTGVPLIFLYRPDDLGWLRGAHNAASMMFLGATVGIVLVLGVAFVRHLSVSPGWFVALGVLVVALTGLVSGQLIAWDQLALREVMAGSNVRGVVDALSGDVRFAVVDGTEVSRSTYVAWAAVHVLAVPLLAFGVAWIGRRRAGPRGPIAAPPD